MKIGAKVLAIIALVIGIIWAFVGFFGTWLGGGVSAGFSILANDNRAAAQTMDSSANTMIKLILSFIVVIIAGVLAIVGTDKKPARIKPIVLGSLTFIGGLMLFPLQNWIAAPLYCIAGFLLILAGFFAKTPSTESAV